MKKTLADKLEKLGYKGRNSDELLAERPKNIWLSENGKQFRQKKTFFALIIRDDGVVFSLSVQDNDSGELYIIHEEKDTIPSSAIARMFIFLHTNKMLEIDV